MISFLSKNHSLLCTEEYLKVDGERVPTTPMERNLLLYFLRYPNTALSRERLLREVWGYTFPGSSRTVDSHIKKLRRDLGSFGRYIVTVHGVGYRLEAEAPLIFGEEPQYKAC